jgi:putative ABC transport system permease protein
MGTLHQDFRYGLRMLRKTPGFTAVAIITLALAIGANTAIFSVVYPVLLKPLPFHDPDRLVTVGERVNTAACCGFGVSYPTFADWQRGTRSFESITGYAPDSFTITGRGEPRTVFGAMVKADFFTTLGVTPMLGRGFLPSEELPEGAGPNVVILGYAFWKTEFAGDPSVIGRTIRLDGKALTIVGVLPRDFDFAPAGIVPIWAPLHLNQFETSSRNARWFAAVARLAPGVSLQQARAEMKSIGAQLARQYPQDEGDMVTDVAPLRDQIVGNVRPILIVLFGFVLFVLLIACVNIANLQMSRSIDRRREMAVRTALGAGKLHLALQLLIESLLLSCAGAILGVIGAAIFLKLMLRSLPEAQLSLMSYLNGVGISLPVLGFVAAIAVLTAVLFGVGPAFSISRTPISEVLKDESRGGTSGTHATMRSALVTVEIAISLVLLVGGGLMFQSLRSLMRQDPGFDAEHLLTFFLTINGNPYPVMKGWPYSNVNALRFEHELLTRLRALPGVAGASATSAMPANDNRVKEAFVVEGRPVSSSGEEMSIARRVDPGYFSVMKMALRHGRFFNESDTADRPWVVIVNEAWVKRYFSAGENVVGKRIRLTRSQQEPMREIVGVIGDVNEESLATAPEPVLYIPVDQDSGYATYLNFAVRTTGDPAALVSAVRSTVSSLDPEMPVLQPQPVSQMMSQSPAIFFRRYPFYIFGSFAVVALVLAIIGLYGLISYSVTQRTREIGIRMALGAQPEHILKIMIRQGVLTTLMGVAAGAAGGLLLGVTLTRLLASMLYGVSSTDWQTFTVVSLLLLGVAMLASYIPARRATQVDPMIALRNE